MSSDTVTLYIKGNRVVEVTKEEVTLGDILSMECADKKIIPKVKSLNCPGIEVQNLGETDIIVTCENQSTPGKWWHMVKTVFVAAVTFFGAAFTIMAFNNDVDVTRLFGQIHELATGEETSGFTILEVTYSVGLTVGILLFFNHFGKKRFTVDPTPMEIQMRLYENDIQTTLVENASRRGDEIDVDSSDSSGSGRT